MAWLTRVARRATRVLRIPPSRRFSVAFVDAATMRRLNYRFTRQQRLTDVFSFRYTEAPVDGEIIVAPAAARRYVARARLPYRQELARYVIHGLLHWLGHEDRTPTQQRRMRAVEDRLLTRCLK